MKHLIIIATIFASLTSLSEAKTWGPATVAQPGFDRRTALDKTLAQLATAQNEVSAQLIADQVWLIFMTAPDNETAEDLNRALRARGGYNFDKALKILDAVIARHPTFTEAWNQRSYVYFLKGNFEQSLADCRNALKLEPRHFGCLSGMARILIRQHNNYIEGERLLRQAMKLHPFIMERVLLKEIPKTDL